MSNTTDGKPSYQIPICACGEQNAAGICKHVANHTILVPATITPFGLNHKIAFQSLVNDWIEACFGVGASTDKQERNHRFMEEALELVQACGCTAEDCHCLVEYVYGRPVGEKFQEAGGVMLTLAGLCTAQDMNMLASGEVELARVWGKIEEIRRKQAGKPKNSPLPK